MEQGKWVKGGWFFFIVWNEGKWERMDKGGGGRTMEWKIGKG